MRLRGEADVMPGLWAREDAEPRRSPVKARDEKALPTLTLRKTRRLAEPRPNAPLLIRIVRRPYGLHPTGRKRVVILEPHTPFQRVDARAERAAAQEDRTLTRFSLRNERRPSAFTVRPSQWVLLPPERPEDT